MPGKGPRKCYYEEMGLERTGACSGRSMTTTTADPVPMKSDSPFRGAMMSLQPTLMTFAKHIASWHSSGTQVTRVGVLCCGLVWLG